MLYRTICLISNIILVLCLAEIGISIGNSQQPQSIKLVGSDLGMNDAIAQSDAVFIGDITKLGIEFKLPPTSPYAGPIYRGVIVTVSQVLRGSISGHITLDLFVDFAKSEKLHKVGTSYIFFVKKGGPRAPNPYHLLKLLSATDYNIAHTKALIAAEPAH